ncbi:uncharacterized protein LOC114881583 [Osmia bicornis bicornis]|uniref:uncharacterized protein LOC114881583 n=1 Tax=Osmia bicornis bicornis TaxID=1437191 RepID=UPI0010F8E702|nr:uncharacterized protein LOC114881583 [Osmia bicornis bicornis]
MATAKLAEQGDISRRIVNFITNSVDKLSPEKRTLEHFTSRAELLERYWDRFTENHMSLAAYQREIKDDPYVKQDVYATTEEAYLDAKVAIKSRMAALDPATSMSSPPSHNVSFRQWGTEASNKISLPKLEIPTFSGVQADWESFKQRFTALIVDHPTMTSVTKLQHLLNAVQDTAARRLKGLPIVESNFRIAWERLTCRFDNVHIRLSVQLENLIMLPQVRNRNARDISDLIDRAEEAVQALRDLQCFKDEDSHFVVHCMLRKLDGSTKETWNVSREEKTGFPTYKEITAFLERRLQSLEQSQVTPSGGDSRKPLRGHKTTPVSVSGANTSSSTKPTLCLCCMGKHVLVACDRFSALKQPQRFAFCKREGLCINCFSKSHRASACPSKARCTTCKQKHHSKLHIFPTATNDQKEISPSLADAPDPPPQEAVVAHSASVNRVILLATAEVSVLNEIGSSYRVRALIDPAAEQSFVSERVVSTLSLSKKRVDVAVVGVGAQANVRAKFEARLTIRSGQGPPETVHASALVLANLSRQTPPCHVVHEDYPHLVGLKLADVAYDRPRRIDLILGADVYPDTIREGLVRGPVGTPIAQASIFGWILTGLASSDDTGARHQVKAYHIKVEPSLQDALAKFWQVEEVPSCTSLSPEDQYCETYFSETVARATNGQYIVRLPSKRQDVIVASR